MLPSKMVSDKVAANRGNLEVVVATAGARVAVSQLVMTCGATSILGDKMHKAMAVLNTM